jgi:hypothetical protein
MSDSPLSASLAALTRFFVGDGTIQETLDRVAGLTVDALPAAEMVGLTLVVEGRQRTRRSSPTRMLPRSTRRSTTPVTDPASRRSPRRRSGPHGWVSDPRSPPVA